MYFLSKNKYLFPLAIFLKCIIFELCNFWYANTDTLFIIYRIPSLYILHNYHIFLFIFSLIIKLLSLHVNLNAYRPFALQYLWNISIVSPSSSVSLSLSLKKKAKGDMHSRCPVMAGMQQSAATYVFTR